MKDADRQRAQHCLEWLDAWRASGMKLKDWCELQGEVLAVWRARLRWDDVWRFMTQPDVPFTNNLAEQTAAKWRMKLKTRKKRAGMVVS